MILREFLDYLKTERRKQKEKEKLLRERLDYELLRKLLNELPYNPGLSLKITLKSGDVIEYRQEYVKEEKDKDEGFDGQDYWSIG